MTTPVKSPYPQHRDIGADCGCEACLKTRQTLAKSIDIEVLERSYIVMSGQEACAYGYDLECSIDEFRPVLSEIGLFLKHRSNVVSVTIVTDGGTTIFVNRRLKKDGHIVEPN